MLGSQKQPFDEARPLRFQSTTDLWGCCFCGQPAGPVSGQSPPSSKSLDLQTVRYLIGYPRRSPDEVELVTKVHSKPPSCARGLAVPPCQSGVGSSRRASPTEFRRIMEDAGCRRVGHPAHRACILLFGERRHSFLCVILLAAGLAWSWLSTCVLSSVRKKCHGS